VTERDYAELSPGSNTAAGNVNGHGPPPHGPVATASGPLLGNSVLNARYMSAQQQQQVPLPNFTYLLSHIFLIDYRGDTRSRILYKKLVCTNRLVHKFHESIYQRLLDEMKGPMDILGHTTYVTKQSFG